MTWTTRPILRRRGRRRALATLAMTAVGVLVVAPFVMAPASAAVAASTLTVNAGQVLRPVTHVATGSLYGLANASQPSVSLASAIKPNTFVQMPAGGHQQPTGDISVVAPTAVSVGAQHVATVQGIEQQLGISPRPIAIEEYASPGEVGLPGPLVGYISKFERLGIHDAELPFWNQSGALGDLIVNKSSGLVLGIQNASTSQGAPALVWGDTGTSDHLWTPVPDGAGHYRIWGVDSGLLLGVSAMSTAAGAQALQWSDSGTADHLWSLTRA